MWSFKTPNLYGQDGAAVAAEGIETGAGIQLPHLANT